MPSTRTKQNTKTLVKRLGTALVERDVKAGVAILERYFAPGVTLNPADPESRTLLFILAQWVDLGFRDIAFLELQFAPFHKTQPLNLSVAQYVPLKLAESYLQLGRRRYSEAIGLLRSLLHLHGEFLTSHQSFASHFWLARAYRQAGNFE